MTKNATVLSLLVLALAASSARAVLPDWSPNLSPEEIRTMEKARQEPPAAETIRPTAPALAEPIYREVFASVSQEHLLSLIKDMSGVNPVTAGGETFTLSERYSPAAKANYRKYWMSYFASLGIPTRELSYPNSHGNGEAEGHNVEAVLKGASPDSVVIIVHYDSIGPNGPDNPGADDDMSGMATLLETARLLAAQRGRLRHTVRFVASDYEEWGGLEGARAYAKYIQDLAKREKFKLVAGIDDEQSGWNEGDGGVFDAFSCGGATDSTALGDLLDQTAQAYSSMKTKRGCMGENSDHYALWEIGVPSVVFSEHDPFNNPHFDQEGGDYFSTIDPGYLLRIAQVGVTFAARVADLSSSPFDLASR